VVESVPSLQASFQVDARSPWRRRPNIEMDSYIIIPASTPFCDIVTIALQRLGYSSDISNTAKGIYCTIVLNAKSSREGHSFDLHNKKIRVSIPCAHKH
jgi:hypothetical protein